MTSGENSVFNQIKEHSLMMNAAIKKLEKSFGHPPHFYKRCANEEGAKKVLTETLNEVSTMNKEAKGLRDSLREQNVATQDLVEQGRQSMAEIEKQKDEILSLLEEKGFEILTEETSDNEASPPQTPAETAIPFPKGTNDQVDCIEKNMEYLRVEGVGAMYMPEDVCVTPYMSKPKNGYK